MLGALIYSAILEPNLANAQAGTDPSKFIDSIESSSSNVGAALHVGHRPFIVSS